MTDALAFLSAWGLCGLGMGALGLAMDRHHELLGWVADRPARRGWLRACGGMLIAAALGPCLLAWSGGIACVVWLGSMTLAAWWVVGVISVWTARR